MRPLKRPTVFGLNASAGGMCGRIIKIMATGSMRHHILSLGLIEGTNITVKDKHPIKKSIQILVRGRNLQLTEELAQKVLVQIDPR